MVKVFVLFLSFMAFGLSQAEAQNRQSYIVKQGETLYSISKKLDVTIAELQRWNNLEGNAIEIGQDLVYYDRSENESADTEKDAPPTDPLVQRSSEPANTYYTVRSGDTLYDIAKAHAMTVSQLKSLNNLSSDAIRVGQQLAVRKNTVAPPSVVQSSGDSSPQGVFSSYQIKRGEGLQEILKRYKMTESEFRKLNPELNLQTLGSGQKVTVLLPPSRNYDNPYLKKANLKDLGQVPVVSYDPEEAGETTTNGELYDPQALTAAHSNISLGSIIYIENPETGNGIYVKVNDRILGSGLKISEQAYEVLRLDPSGTSAVSLFMESND